MKAPSLPDVRDYVPDDACLIDPVEDSHMGLSVPGVVFDYGKKSAHFKNAWHILPSLVKALLRAMKSYRSLRNNPSSRRAQADSDLFTELENRARKLGCHDIGYTKVPRDYIFKNKRILFDNAIVATMDMDQERIGKAPSITAGKEVWRTYAKLGGIVNHLAKFLRDQGYKAAAGPAIGGEVNYSLLAQKAGLGYIGKHGMLISKRNGPSQRIAVVYTNIENLPYTDSNRYAWIPAFCESCGRCVAECPAGAIYADTLVFEDGSHQHIDYKKCAIPFSETVGCSICIKECTFFSSDFDRIERQFKKSAGS